MIRLATRLRNDWVRIEYHPLVTHFPELSFEVWAEPPAWLVSEAWA